MQLHEKRVFKRKELIQKISLWAWLTMSGKTSRHLEKVRNDRLKQNRNQTKSKAMWTASSRNVFANFKIFHHFQINNKIFKIKLSNRCNSQTKITHRHWFFVYEVVDPSNKFQNFETFIHLTIFYDKSPKLNQKVGFSVNFDFVIVPNRF